MEKRASGFADPTENYIEPALSLDQKLVKNPLATFFMQIADDSLKGAGLLRGDLVLVDRSLYPKPEDLVVLVQGERLSLGRWQVSREKDAFWGVVTYAIRQLR